MSDTRPNILVFFTDQQRWDTCGCYGQRLDITPNLDRMAAEGLRFEQAITCQPVCGPARSCLQTGKYATETGCVTNGIAMRLDEDTIARRLNAAGYETGYLGKWHLASDSKSDDPASNYRTLSVPPERRGGYEDYWLASDVLEWTSHSYDGHMFDADGNRVEFPEGRYRADAVTDYLLEFLESRSGSKPWFLFASYIEPHHQNDNNRYEGPHGSKERFADYDVPGDLADTEGDWRENYPDYLGCCAALDANLGRVRQKLEELGMAENTVILFTSDHGSHFRTRNSEYKRSCHDACVRIPLVAAGPGFPAGQVSSKLASLIDVPKTILTAAGVDVPDHVHGHALQQAPDATDEQWRDEVFIQISESHCGRAIRDHRWKYSVRAPDQPGSAPGADVYVEDYLYDLQADPHERNNLVAEAAFADVRADLAERLKRHMAEAHEPIPEIRPA